MFGFKNKSQSEESLRMECIKYSISMLQSYYNNGYRPLINPITLADVIFNYIKTGAIDKRIKDKKMGD